jgi:hypothetical protein
VGGEEWNGVKNWSGEASIYSGRGVLRGFTVASMAMALWAAKGQGEDGVWLLASWRSSSACWRREKWTGWLGRLQRLSRVRRKSSTTTTVTGNGGEREHVWRLAGVLAMLLVGADGEARTEATGRDRVLARLGA